MHRLIDQENVAVVGPSIAARMVGTDAIHFHTLARTHGLQTRMARRGELRTQERLVYLLIEVQALARLKVWFNGRIPRPGARFGVPRGKHHP